MIRRNNVAKMSILLFEVSEVLKINLEFLIQGDIPNQYPTPPSNTQNNPHLCPRILAL